MTLPTTSQVRVWDLPTRVFHWSLVICVIGAFITIKLGGLWMDWHVRFGLTTLGLLLFRLAWGIAGPHYARFSQFVRGPLSVWRYLKGQDTHLAGHNPLGAWSVLAMLGVFGFQAFSGLFADDDIFTTGPLAYLSSTWSTQLTGLHKLNEWPMITLVALHLGGILWYHLVHKQKLVNAMITGNTEVFIAAPSTAIPQSKDTWKLRLLALLLAAGIATFIWWITTLAPSTLSYY